MNSSHLSRATFFPLPGLSQQVLQMGVVNLRQGGRTNALSKACGLAGGFDDSTGLLASPGQGWRGYRIRPGIRTPNRRYASTATTDMRRTLVRLTATTDPAGFRVVLFIGAGPWYHGYYGRPGLEATMAAEAGVTDAATTDAQAWVTVAATTDARASAYGRGSYGRAAFGGRGFAGGPVGRLPRWRRRRISRCSTRWLPRWRWTRRRTPLTAREV